MNTYKRDYLIFFRHFKTIPHFCIDLENCTDVTPVPYSIGKCRDFYYDCEEEKYVMKVNHQLRRIHNNFNNRSTIGFAYRIAQKVKCLIVIHWNAWIDW